MAFISSDYVFDGRKKGPYTEMDEAGPLNVYGQSKLAGEREVLKILPRALVVRTQSLFGVYGRNFVEAVRGKLLARGRADVVDDQTVCPTYTKHLAGALLTLARRECGGVVNVCASGSCTWHGVAVEIAMRVRPGAEVSPVRSAELKRAAKRPANSVFDCGLYERLTRSAMPSWRVGLEEYLAACAG